MKSLKELHVTDFVKMLAMEEIPEKSVIRMINEYLKESEGYKIELDWNYNCIKACFDKECDPRYNPGLYDITMETPIRKYLIYSYIKNKMTSYSDIETLKEICKRYHIVSEVRNKKLYYKKVIRIIQDYISLCERLLQNDRFLMTWDYSERCVLGLNFDATKNNYIITHFFTHRGNLHMQIPYQFSAQMLDQMIFSHVLQMLLFLRDEQENPLVGVKMINQFFKEYTHFDKLVFHYDKEKIEDLESWEIESQLQQMVEENYFYHDVKNIEMFDSRNPSLTSFVVTIEFNSEKLIGKDEDDFDEYY